MGFAALGALGYFVKVNFYLDGWRKSVNIECW
jgi:hypothetical protein